MESDVVVIPVDAHLLTLTISTPEIVVRPVRVGRETRMRANAFSVRVRSKRNAARPL